MFSSNQSLAALYILCIVAHMARVIVKGLVHNGKKKKDRQDVNQQTQEAHKAMKTIKGALSETSVPFKAPFAKFGAIKPRLYRLR